MSDEAVVVVMEALLAACEEAGPAPPIAAGTGEDRAAAAVATISRRIAEAECDEALLDVRER